MYEREKEKSLIKSTWLNKMCTLIIKSTWLKKMCTLIIKHTDPKPWKYLRMEL